MAKEVDIYTDGGCDPNPGVGGWGAVLIAGEHYKELSGGEDESTNNRMELTAAIEALKALKRPSTVRLHTDSQYLQKGITQWMANWKKRNWRTRTGPVKNKDLWLELDELIQKHDVHWAWVRGHAGIPENERCHDLASAEIQTRKNQRR